MRTPIVDANVQPNFRYNSEIRRYLAPPHKLRAIPDVEQQWYQAPGGDYRQDLYDDGYPGSDPETVARHLFEDRGVDMAILNPLTRGTIADYLPHSQVCASTNDWLVEQWLTEHNDHRLGPGDDPRQSAGRDQLCGVRDREVRADHPYMVQVGVPLQSKMSPTGSRSSCRCGRRRIAASACPWQCTSSAAHRASTARRLPPAIARTPIAHTRPNMPLNFFIHLASLIIEGVFERYAEPAVRLPGRRLGRYDAADVPAGHVDDVAPRSDAVGPRGWPSEYLATITSASAPPRSTVRIKEGLDDLWMAFHD